MINHNVILKFQKQASMVAVDIKQKVITITRIRFKVCSLNLTDMRLWVESVYDVLDNEAYRFQTGFYLCF